MGQLEVKLTEQLDLIEGAVAEQLSTHAEGDHGASEANEELAALRRELAETNAAWALEHQQAASDATNRAQQLDEHQAKLDVRAEELSVGRRDLELRQQALDDRATQLNARERELRHVQDELDARSQELARQQSQFAFTESGFAQRESELAANEFALQATRQSLGNREGRRAIGRAKPDGSRGGIAGVATCDRGARDGLAGFAAANSSTTRPLLLKMKYRGRPIGLRSKSSEAASMSSSRSLPKRTSPKAARLPPQLADARRELAAQQNAWQDEQSRFEEERLVLNRNQDAIVRERDALADQLASFTEQDRAAAAELANQLAAAQQQLESQQAAWNTERLALARERDELSTALSSAGERLTASNAQSDAAAERDELQQKFDLVMADMQRLRSRAFDLEQELASRPAAEQTDSAELIGLRAERDTLLSRIANLEQQPVANVDADTSQQITDLQRRFELAVEDVRDLKKQNSQLEAQIKAAKSVHPVAAGPAGKNWEAVKKQLLASLESESGEATPEQQKEHTSIANTVRINRRNRRYQGPANRRADGSAGERRRCGRRRGRRRCADRGRRF